MKNLARYGKPDSKYNPQASQYQYWIQWNIHTPNNPLKPKNARDIKDAIVTKFQSDDNSGFLKLRDNYANESLEEFVTNKNESSKIIEFKGEIIQKLEPIYMDPKFKFIRAHFYSPTKQIFGKKLDTFIMNVIVLWVITILLYLILYFRLLKKLLESGEVFIGRNLKNSD